MAARAGGVSIGTMSGNGGGGRVAGSGGAGATTASATTKMLQNIKEIVGSNFPEDEIRAMLRECNMDPGETVHRLLNQGPICSLLLFRRRSCGIETPAEVSARTV